MHFMRSSNKYRRLFHFNPFSKRMLQMSVLIQPIIVLLSLSFFSRIAMFISAQLSDFIGVALLFFFFIMHFPLNKLIRHPLFAAPLLPLCLIFQFKNPFFSLLAVSVFLYCVSIFDKSEKNESPTIPALFLTSVGFLLFQLLYQGFAFLWFAFDSFSKYSSLIATHLFHLSINSGSTYAGTHISVLILLFSFFVYAVSRPSKWFFWCIPPVGVIIATLFYLGIQPNVSQVMIQTIPNFYMVSLHLQILQFLLNAPLLFFVLKTAKESANNSAYQNKIAKIILPLLFGISAAALFFLNPLSTRTKQNPSVLFLEKGGLDLSVPTFDTYGARSGGMFGSLFKDYLPAMGFSTAHDTIVTVERLKNTDIVVIINPYQMFKETDKKLLWDFVRNGGSLLAMGDHTGVAEIREPLNDLLQPVGISLNFDAGIFWNDPWADAFEWRPHFTNSGISDELETQIRIGASLRILPPSKPVVIARYCFSDNGNMLAANNGFLGDMHYTQGERLGDLVLVAEAKLGKGKVLVFGDTTPFQNDALQYCYNYIAGIFSWFVSSENGIVKRNSIEMLFLLLLCCIGGLLVFKKGRSLPTMCSFVLACSLFLLLKSNAAGNYPNEGTLKYSKKMAIIDASHFEPLNPDSWKDDGIGGLVHNLMRNRFLPIVMKSFSSYDIANCKVLVLIAPKKQFSGSEIEAIEHFVSQGGLLLITAGYEQSAALGGLLSRFSLELEPVPLGKITPEDNHQGISFCNAWPVRSTSGNQVKVLCESWEHSVALYKQYGKGGIFVAGDSRFLFNENLEGIDNVSLGNIQFIRRIFENEFNEVIR